MKKKKLLALLQVAMGKALVVARTFLSKYDLLPMLVMSAVQSLTSSWENVKEARLPYASELVPFASGYNADNWEMTYANDLINFLNQDIGKEIDNINTASEWRSLFQQYGGGRLLLPEWVTTSLYSTGNDNYFDYCTLTPYIGDEAYIWAGEFMGALDLVSSDCNNFLYGIRPVIVLNKSDIK